MSDPIDTQSVLGRIAALVTDPHSRQGRVYPLVAILGMLLLGAVEGEGSLRGMWMRGKKYGKNLTRRLGVVGCFSRSAVRIGWRSCVHQMRW